LSTSLSISRSSLLRSAHWPAVAHAAHEAHAGAPRPEETHTQLLSDSPRFAKSLLSLAEVVYSLPMRIE